jgi:hypothetical protein
VATDLLADLRERGLRTSGGLLVVMESYLQDLWKSPLTTR